MDPDDVGPRIFFQQVPDDKPDQMNRPHLDVVVSDPAADEQERRAAQRAEADRIVELGATVVGRVEDLDRSWMLLRDAHPHGRERDDLRGDGQPHRMCGGKSREHRPAPCGAATTLASRACWEEGKRVHGCSPIAMNVATERGRSGGWQQ